MAESAEPVRKAGSKIGSRLISIDALRGLAALGVVLCHTTGLVPCTPPGARGGSVAINDWYQPIAILFSFGALGVYLFFVISGFCIHMRWAKAAAADRTPDVGFVAFWKRRIRRLYPPYLIAFAIYLLVLYAEAVAPNGRLVTQPMNWHVADGAVKFTPLFWYDVGMHLVMMHNLDVRTVYSINGVFWTLAIEEQLYLAYFLLLFLRNRFGWIKTLAVTLAMRFAWFGTAMVVHRIGVRFNHPVEMVAAESAMSNWFMWALGAVGVEAALGLTKLPRWCYNLRVAWGVLALSCGFTLLVRELLAFKPAWFPASAAGLALNLGWLLMPPLWGLGFFVLANYFVTQERTWLAGKGAGRFIQAVAGVGVFSYSLYLMHELFLQHLVHWIPGMAEKPNALLLLACTPLAVLFAYLFFQLFERPFLTKPSPARVAEQPA